MNSVFISRIFPSNLIFGAFRYFFEESSKKINYHRLKIASSIIGMEKVNPPPVFVEANGACCGSRCSAGLSKFNWGGER